MTGGDFREHRGDLGFEFLPRESAAHPEEIGLHGIIPVRLVDHLADPDVVSIWHIVWADNAIYVGNSPRARWGRFRARWSRRWRQAKDAWEVLQGRAEARSWDDCE